MSDDRPTVHRTIVPSGHLNGTGGTAQDQRSRCVTDRCQSNRTPKSSQFTGSSTVAVSSLGTLTTLWCEAFGGPRLARSTIDLKLRFVSRIPHLTTPATHRPRCTLSSCPTLPQSILRERTITILPRTSCVFPVLPSPLSSKHVISSAVIDAE